MRKRIYFASFYYPPLNRSRRRYHYARALADAGFEVRVLTVANPSGLLNRFMPDPELAVDDPDIEVIRLRTSAWWALGELLYATGMLACPQANWGRALARDLAPRLKAEPGVVLGIYPPLGTHTACLRAAKAAGCPLVLDFRDEYLKSALKGMGGLFAGRARRIEGYLVRGADLVSVHAEPARDYLVERNGIDPEKVVVVRNGFGGKLPEVAPRDFEGRLRIVYAGAITRHQGPEVLCRAWRLLRERDPASAAQISITFFGPENHYVASALRPLLHEPEVTYGGVLGADRVGKRLAESDVAFLSLAADHVHATPTKLFEYIGHGKPVIASVPDGEAAWIVRENDLGIVVPPGDAGKLADALASAVTDRDLLRRFARNGLAVRERFTLGEQVAALADEIEGRLCS